MLDRHLAAIDIEDALRLDIPAVLQGVYDIDAAAPPVPQNLGSELPIAIPQRIGGNRYSMVVDEHTVSIDVYADSWAEAQKAGGYVVDALTQLPYSNGLSAGYYETSVTTLPYNNPDPRHPDIPRVSVNAQVLTRAVSKATP